MASFGARSFRCFSRAGQAFSFGSRLRSQGRVLQGQSAPVWRQFNSSGSLTRQVTRRYLSSVARVMSTSLLTGSLQTTSLCLISGAVGSGDLIESCNGDDEGLVIPALDDESDL